MISRLIHPKNLRDKIITITCFSALTLVIVKFSNCFFNRQEKGISEEPCVKTPSIPPFSQDSLLQAKEEALEKVKSQLNCIYSEAGNYETLEQRNLRIELDDQYHHLTREIVALKKNSRHVKDK